MRCIDWKELKTIVPYSRVHIGRLEKAGTDPFPQRVPIGQCRVCWMLDEVQAWLQRRMNRREATDTPV